MEQGFNGDDGLEGLLHEAHVGEGSEGCDDNEEDAGEGQCGCEVSEEGRGNTFCSV